VGDRGGGKPPPCGPPPLLAVAHSHHGPVHGEISEKPRTRRPTSSTPDTAALLIYARARTPPGAGRGRSAEGAGGVGVAGEGRMSASAGRGAGKGCRREVRWLECGRQGRGNKFPLPVSLSPSGDIHHGPVHGEILEKSRARLPTGSTPGTAAPLIYARALPTPPIGAGEERRRRGWGGGAGRSAWVSLRRHGAGRGCRQKHMGILCRRRGRGGGCRQKDMGILCRRRGRRGAAGRERMG